MMASATTTVVNSTKSAPVLCRFYMNGVCRDGSSCRYSHDRETSAPDMVCRYYLQGCCSYGAHCRYDHVKPRPVSPHLTLSPPLFESTPYTLSPVSQQSCQEPPDLQSYEPKNTESKLIDLWDKEIQDDLDTYYSSWSSAPSASDKVILRGGRIKTKADWAKDSPVFVPQAPVNVPVPQDVMEEVQARMCNWILDDAVTLDRGRVVSKREWVQDAPVFVPQIPRFNHVPQDSYDAPQIIDSLDQEVQDILGKFKPLFIPPITKSLIDHVPQDSYDEPQINDSMDQEVHDISGEFKPLLNSTFRESLDLVPQDSYDAPQIIDSMDQEVHDISGELKPLFDPTIRKSLDLVPQDSYDDAPQINDSMDQEVQDVLEWFKPLFVPTIREPLDLALSYAQVADSSAAPKDPSLENLETMPCYLSENIDDICNDSPKSTYTENELCPYLAHGACPNMERCCYVHGDVCEMCGLNVLHPTDMEQRQKHELECLREHEANMEYSFLVAQSKDKECSICMEVVFEKTPPENRFGLLPNCNHVFCLTCIRKWRSSTLDKDVIRRCPECRITSNYVTPSNVWVEDKETKEKIITTYKETMKNKPCKYFDQGRKMCPFSDSCFYLHAYPDGTIATPDQHVRQRQRADANGRMSTVNSHSLWDFIFQRERTSIYDDDDDLSFSPLTTDSDSEDIS